MRLFQRSGSAGPARMDDMSVHAGEPAVPSCVGKISVADYQAMVQIQLKNRIAGQSELGDRDEKVASFRHGPPVRQSVEGQDN